MSENDRHIAHPVFYRPKSNWASVGPADAFKAALPIHFQLRAQRLFYQAAESAMASACALCRESSQEAQQPFTEPRIGPAFALAPANFGTWASIGLSAFRQVHRLARKLRMSEYIHKYLSNPASYDDVTADPNAYRDLVRKIADCVQKRLYLERLRASEKTASIETYRLLMCALSPLRFDDHQEILEAAILYSELLPLGLLSSLPTASRAKLEQARAISQPFLHALPEPQTEELRRLGIAWVRAMGPSLSTWLPPAEKRAGKDGEFDPSQIITPKGQGAILQTPPLPGTGPGTGLSKKALRLKGGKNSRDGNESSIDLHKLMEKAGGGDTPVDQPRWDIIESHLRTDSFGDGPLAGSPIAGHGFRIKVGQNRVYRGDVFSRVLPPYRNPAALKKLLPRAEKLSGSLKNILYPSIEPKAMVLRYLSSGRVDAGRLALAKFTDAIFKRYKILPSPDPRGRPLLVLACDGSASLNVDQMTLLKVLAGGWLLSTAKTGVRMLAGIYNSGQVRPGLKGPMVQWFHHPSRPWTLGHREAAEKLLALPDSGTGKQADALSLSLFFDEALRISRDETIYFLWMTDGAWNKSLPGEQTGKDEVRAVLTDVLHKHPNRFHMTLAGLGIDWETGFEDMIDSILLFPPESLDDPDAIANRISSFLAERLKQTNLQRFSRLRAGKDWR